MQTAALLLTPKPIPMGRHHRRAQELTSVITRHSPRFRRIAFAHLGNTADAEDAVQDAFLSALRHLDQFRGQAKMSTWLTSIVINSARIKLRRRATQVQIALDETFREQNLSLADVLSDTRPDPEQAYRKREIAAALTDAISRLSPILRMTFQLRDVDGLSICETAHLMEVPAGTVKARLARARKRLGEAMGNSVRRRHHRSSVAGSKD
jgi:RNA polymerase sigma-70 factor, ECF subfamily